MRIAPWLAAACCLGPALTLAAPAEGAPRRIRIAVTELRPLNAEQAKADLLSEVALTEASRFRALEVIGKSDIAALLGFEQQKKVLGCGEDSACLAEIGGALGVDYLLVGSLGRLGSLYRIDLKLVEAKKARVLERFGESVTAEEEKLVGTVQRGVRHLLGPLARGTAPERAVAPSPSGPMRFDGAWTVVIDCPTDAGRSGARGYRHEFEATVTSGLLVGSFGTEGQPNWLRLEGRIQPDGKAQLAARGLTGDPSFAVKRSPPGSPYGYRVLAEFQGDSGTGSRVEHRPCGFTFTRR